MGCKDTGMRCRHNKSFGRVRQTRWRPVMGSGSALLLVTAGNRTTGQWISIHKLTTVGDVHAATSEHFNCRVCYVNWRSF